MNKDYFRWKSWLLPDKLVHDSTRHPSMGVLCSLASQGLVFVRISLGGQQLLQEGVGGNLKILRLEKVDWDSFLHTSTLAELDTPPPRGTEPTMTASNEETELWK